MKNYDYLIVGAGIFGAVFAYEMHKKGMACLVIDKRSHIAGNAYTENINGINVHRYGAHIFHTSNKDIWSYVNNFAEFNNYVNSPIACYEDELFNLPFNMNTFHQLWGVTTPAEAQAEINDQKIKYGSVNPANLEEQALSLVGYDIYEKLIKGYTEKQWGKQCKELPASIIKRIPLRFTFNNNYFNDKYQGIPIGGYTDMVEKLLNGCDVFLNCNYFDFISEAPNIAKSTLYTGAIDEFYKYQYGELEYRSLRFEEKILDIDNFQGNAVVNYTAENIPYTRVIEHKHFEFGQQNNTIISYEYPMDWKRGLEPYYPINDEKNNRLYKKYKLLADESTNILFGGRLGQYAYLDMDKTIASALELVKGIA